MKVKTEMQNAAKVQAAFAKSAETAKRELRLALKIALRDVQERAQDKHRFKTRTGNLERSIQTRVVSEWPIEGEVYLDPSATMITEGKWKGFSYGFFVHEGTKAHEIKPRNKKCLRWASVIGGAREVSAADYAGMRKGEYRKGSKFTFAMAVNHPGTKQDPFILNALKKSQRHINEVFAARLQRAVKEAGL